MNHVIHTVHAVRPILLSTTNRTTSVVFFFFKA